MDATATYQGKPCKHGHVGLRYTSNRQCVECHREIMQEKAKAKKLPVVVKWPYTPAQQARLKGWKMYYGRMCIYGHDGLRYITSNQCVDCARERNTPAGKAASRKRMADAYDLLVATAQETARKKAERAAREAKRRPKQQGAETDPLHVLLMI